MIACPLCQQTVEINDRHHGALFTCPHCAGVFFVNWSGQPETPEQESENLFQSATQEEGFQTEEPFYQAPTEELAFDAQSYEAPVAEAPAVEASADFESAQSFEATPSFESTPSFDAVPSFEAPAMESYQAASSQSDSSDLSDISSFANSSVSIENISYSLRIEGIDTAQVRTSVLEALTDPRFGWRVEELKALILNGVLELQGLNTAKVYVLVERLQYLPVNTQWRQDVLSN